MKQNEEFINDGTWKNIGIFGGCYVYAKKQKRILVKIDTNIIVSIYE